jgi:DNA modification methylase
MIRILQGDCRSVLRTLPDASVHCVCTSPPYYSLRSYLPNEHPDKHAEIGQEKSPEEYVAELVTVFREVKRVLHPSGVAFLNLGDSYAAGGMGPGSGKQLTNIGEALPPKKAPDGYKPKDLLGIPWMVAFALRAEGWWLRSAIVWSKPNPMPESCRDRPTSSYEMVFLLAKEARYFWDATAVAEPVAPATANDSRIGTDRIADYGSSSGRYGAGVNASRTAARNAVGSTATRNARNVLTFSSEPFNGAKLLDGSTDHFAVMPSALAEWCVRAGTSQAGCCPHCLAPWQRIVERGEPDRDWQRACGGDAAGEYAGQSRKDHDAAGVQNASDVKRRILDGMREKRTTGWRPTCDCPEHTPRACTVLDCFSGAGTTLLAADRLRRDAIGIELSRDYVAMSERRLRGDAGLFAEVTAA